MKKSEKIIAALLLMALGVMFIVLKDNFIGILMTVAGVCLIALGVVDIVNRNFPLSIVKIISGFLLIIAGWAIMEAVLYILSGLLLVGGILLFYDKIKNRSRCASIWQAILNYATLSVCVAIGVLLLFHRAGIVNFVFIVSGVLIIVEGGLLLFEGLLSD